MSGTTRRLPLATGELACERLTLGDAGHPPLLLSLIHI